MSRTSRARKLSALIHLSYQQALQHLSRLGCGPRDEKKYVDSLDGAGPVHAKTCACNRLFFSSASESRASCPRCLPAASTAASPAPEHERRQPNPDLQSVMEEMGKSIDFGSSARTALEEMRKAMEVGPSMKASMEEMRKAADFGSSITTAMEAMRKAGDLPGKHPQEMTEAANPAQRLQEMKMAEKVHSARSLHDMMSASDPARRLQKMKLAEKAHSARSLQEMMNAADPGKPK
jgi:hypothetical protein